jgi:hypothetical protein
MARWMVYGGGDTTNEIVFVRAQWGRCDDWVYLLSAGKGARRCARTDRGIYLEKKIKNEGVLQKTMFT